MADHLIRPFGHITSEGTTLRNMSTCFTRTEPQALTTQLQVVCAWTSATSLPGVVGFGDAASLAHTGTDKQGGPDFKGRRSSSTTLVCWAGGCPLQSDAKASMLNLTEKAEREDVRDNALT